MIDEFRRDDESFDTGRVRALKAVAVVLAIVVAAPGVEAVTRFVAGPQEALAEGTANRVLDSARMLDATDAFGSLDRLEAVARDVESDAPTAFLQEVGLLSDARDVRASQKGDVVGFVVPGSCEDVFARVVESLELRGWSSVPLGAEQGATFVKSSGAYTWALVTCTQVGDSTSVVVRSVMS